MELKKRDELKNSDTIILDSLIKIVKSEGMLFTYQIKIFNITEKFELVKLLNYHITNKRILQKKMWET